MRISDWSSDVCSSDLALVSLLEALDAEVSLATGLPAQGDDVALLLRDDLDDEQLDLVLDWVEDGGRLVVTDPGSPLTPLTVDRALLDLPTGPISGGSCNIEALAAVEEVEAGSAERYEITPGEIGRAHV